MGRLLWQRFLNASGESMQWEGWDASGQSPGVYTVVLHDRLDPSKRTMERLVVIRD